MKTVNIIGALVEILSIVLGLIWYDWKLMLVIFLFVMGNNMERSGRK